MLDKQIHYLKPRLRFAPSIKVIKLSTKHVSSYY